MGSEWLECICQLYTYCIDRRSNDICSEMDEILPVQTSPIDCEYLQTAEIFCKLHQYLEHHRSVMQYLVWCHRMALEGQQKTQYGINKNFKISNECKHGDKSGIKVIEIMLYRISKLM